MRIRALASNATGVTIGLLLLAACGTGDSSARHHAIEVALLQKLPWWQIATGVDLRLYPAELAQLRPFESRGFIEIRQFPDGYAVIATPKLVSLVSNPDDVWTTKDQQQFLGGEPETLSQYRTRTDKSKARIRVYDVTIARVFTDAEYTGPLATPGEKHRLVLGTINAAASTQARAVDTTLRPAPTQMRFRCVTRYSDMKKEWTAVACDLGTVNPERWLSDDVR